MTGYFNGDYVVVLSIVMIQFVVLASLLYQLRQVSKNVGEGGKAEVKPTVESSSSVSQLEFDVAINKVAPERPQVGGAGVEGLNDDEVKVLRYLISKGAEAYQAEIARELGLPKSTVSRIVRRLYERGFIIIKRSGRMTYIQVTDPDYISDILSKLDSG
ncbi:helix-turn-helix transcriptional regulator [Vulcanisaeta thermophila]|uniref:helix-turn-helix transcriptional regulator n=1 Tax=Vulcanisaeta thermophila TaxID=867917 RepID=UPI0008533758|nr:MarR family transcriptional regulator [Vulcanisaeta thermophila]